MQNVVKWLMGLTTTRMLKPEEYHLLEKIPQKTFSGDWIPHPDHSRIVVAERRGQIIGFLVIQEVVHLEPIWIAPSWRKKSVAARLWTAAVKYLGKKKIDVFYLGSKDWRIRDYVKRFGVKPFGEMFQGMTAEVFPNQKLKRKRRK